MLQRPVPHQLCRVRRFTFHLFDVTPKWSTKTFLDDDGPSSSERPTTSVFVFRPSHLGQGRRRRSKVKEIVGDYRLGQSLGDRFLSGPNVSGRVVPSWVSSSRLNVGSLYRIMVVRSTTPPWGLGVPLFRSLWILSSLLLERIKWVSRRHLEKVESHDVHPVSLPRNSHPNSCLRLLTVVLLTSLDRREDPYLQHIVPVRTLF